LPQIGFAQMPLSGDRAKARDQNSSKEFCQENSEFSWHLSPVSRILSELCRHGSARFQ
jgi:hypothetical protein